MGSILSETRAGQVIQLIGVVIVLLAVADHIGIVDLLSIWFYPVIITPLGYLRWLCGRQHESGEDGRQET